MHYLVTLCSPVLTHFAFWTRNASCQNCIYLHIIVRLYSFVFFLVFTDIIIICFVLIFYHLHLCVKWDFLITIWNISWYSMLKLSCTISLWLVCVCSLSCMNKAKNIEISLVKKWVLILLCMQHKCHMLHVESWCICFSALLLMPQ